VTSRGYQEEKIDEGMESETHFFSDGDEQLSRVNLPGLISRRNKMNHKGEKGVICYDFVSSKDGKGSLGAGKHNLNRG
jgi:hypothetical protein